MVSRRIPNGLLNYKAEGRKIYNCNCFKDLTALHLEWRVLYIPTALGTGVKQFCLICESHDGNDDKKTSTHTFVIRITFECTCVLNFKFICYNREDVYKRQLLYDVTITS